MSLRRKEEKRHFCVCPMIDFVDLGLPSERAISRTCQIVILMNLEVRIEATDGKVLRIKRECLIRALKYVDSGDGGRNCTQL